MAQKYFVEVKDGITTWYSDPEMKIRHRTGGPAVVCADGSQHWYQNGLIHRDDGPSIILSEGRRHWHQHGVLHRLDGPAVESDSGTRWYFIEGKKYSRAAFERRVKELTEPRVREMTMAELEAALGHPIKIIK